MSGQNKPRNKKVFQTRQFNPTHPVCMSLLRAGFYEVYAEQQTSLNTARTRPMQSLQSSCLVGIFFWAGTESPQVLQGLPLLTPTLGFLAKSFTDSMQNWGKTYGRRRLAFPDKSVGRGPRILLSTIHPPP